MMIVDCYKASQRSGKKHIKTSLGYSWQSVQKCKNSIQTCT